MASHKLTTRHLQAQAFGQVRPPICRQMEHTHPRIPARPSLHMRQRCIITGIIDHNDFKIAVGLIEQRLYGHGCPLTRTKCGHQHRYQWAIHAGQRISHCHIAWVGGSRSVLQRQGRHAMHLQKSIQTRQLLLGGRHLRHGLVQAQFRIAL